MEESFNTADYIVLVIFLLGLVAVTFVLSNYHIFLALDNPQWPLPKLHPLPDRDDLLPPYSGVIKKEITDVEKLVYKLVRPVL